MLLFIIHVVDLVVLYVHRTGVNSCQSRNMVRIVHVRIVQVRIVQVPLSC